MSGNYQCKRIENEAVISILETEKNRRLLRQHGPQTELPFIKAMKKVSKIDFVIQNEWHAKAIDCIGDDIAEIINIGLVMRGIYNRGMGPIHETRRCQDAIKRQLAKDIEERKNKKQRAINKKYIPKKQGNGQNTATRAMFIVLALSRKANENGLDKNTIISRARHLTPVDFNAKHDTYRVYGGFAGMATLIEKGYVTKQRKNKLYKITEAGYRCYFEHCQPSSPPSLELNELNVLQNEDLELQRVLMASQLMQPHNGYNEEKELERALRISQLETMHNISNNNSDNNNNSDVAVSLVEKRTYFCRICIPNKTYKSQKHYAKHMEKHNNINNHICVKRKQLDEMDEYDSEIEILPVSPHSAPPKKKHKKSVQHCANSKIVIESSAMRPTKIKCDLDAVKLQNNSYLNNKKSGCYVKFDGKAFRLKLYIDFAEQNLKNTSLHYFDVLGHVKQKGVFVEYQKLANADYVIVISQDININNNKSNVYMIDFAVERKRWDDLAQSVLVDGRGKQQKERLELTPIARKYYMVEGNERMIGNVGKRGKCKHFLKQTQRDGYMVKYTQSKQETINKICDWYYKLLYFFNHRNVATELVLTNSYGFPYSFQEFQESQR